MTNNALYTATEFFSVPAGASSRELRINGAKCVGTALLCFLAGISGIWLGGVESGAQASLLPLLTGYGFMLVGGYRLVFGKRGESAAGASFSLVRVLFGVTWIAAVFGVPLLLLIYFTRP